MYYTVGSDVARMKDLGMPVSTGTAIQNHPHDQVIDQFYIRAPVAAGGRASGHLVVGLKFPLFSKLNTKFVSRSERSPDHVGSLVTALQTKRSDHAIPVNGSEMRYPQVAGATSSEQRRRFHVQISCF